MPNSKSKNASTQSQPWQPSKDTRTIALETYSRSLLPSWTQKWLQAMNGQQSFKSEKAWSQQTFKEMSKHMDLFKQTLKSIGSVQTNVQTTWKSSIESLETLIHCIHIEDKASPKGFVTPAISSASSSKSSRLQALQILVLPCNFTGSKLGFKSWGPSTAGSPLEAPLLESCIFLKNSTLDAQTES